VLCRTHSKRNGGWSSKTCNAFGRNVLQFNKWWYQAPGISVGVLIERKERLGENGAFGLISCHPEISMHHPQPTFAAMAQDFSRECVRGWSEVLINTVDDDKMQAIRMFNVDETALSNVQKPRKILAVRGKHQVGTNTTRVLHECSWDLS